MRFIIPTRLLSSEFNRLIPSLVMLRRLGRSALGRVRSQVPNTCVPFRAHAIQKRAFHRLPILRQSATPAKAAQEEDWNKVEQYLLSIGADPDEVHPEIWQDLLHRDSQSFKKTLEFIPDNKKERTLWLHFAIEAQDETAAALLMRAGADLTRQESYRGGLAAAPYRAIHKNMTELVRKMWQLTKHTPNPRRGGGRLLHNWWLAVAAECGHAAMVQDMLGWDADWDYDMALYWAAYNWQYETVKLLTREHTYSQTAVQQALGHACDVEREDDFEIECCDKSTETRRRELTDVIRWLLDAGADLDNIDPAWIGGPVVAIFHKYPEHVEELNAVLKDRKSVV